MRRPSDPFELIRLANPVPDPDRMPDEPDTASAEALVEEIIGMHNTGSKTGNKARRLRRTLLAAATILMLGATAAIGVGGYLGEDVPGSPWIPLEEAADRVPELGADIPTPPGRDFSGRAESYLRMLDMGPGRVQEAGVVEALGRDAVCMWAAEWMTAVKNGDSGKEKEAVSMIESARGWPYWTVNNAESIDDNLTGLAEAMHSRSADPVADNLRLNCADYTLSP